MPVKTPSKMMLLMEEKLNHQTKTAFCSESFEDTKRCVFPEDKSMVSEYDLEFACVELLQNAADHVRPVLEASAKRNSSRIAEIACTDTSIKFKLRKEVALEVSIIEKGFSIKQVGLPLSLDATGSGTRSKRSDDSCTGGFGDGLKTGALSIARFGAKLEFVFDNYGKHVGKPADDRIVWTWKASLHGHYTEPHLVCDIRTSKRPPEEAKESDVPTMITSVQVDSLEDAKVVHRALVTALSRFSWLLYTINNDHNVVASDKCGAWRRACSFKPAVASLAGNAICMPSGPVVEVGGLFYPMQGGQSCGPEWLVISVLGRGMPYETDQVFTNQLREPNYDCVRRIFCRQFMCFHSDMDSTDTENDRAKMCQMFKPLLLGSSSVIMADGKNPGSLVQDLLISYRMQIRKMLLYQKLKRHNPKDSMDELLRKVANTVVATSATESKARYLQALNGNGGVIKVNAKVANMDLFAADHLDWMEHHAASYLASEVFKDDGIVENVNADLRPAINFIAGESLRVFRVHKTLEHVEPYTFRSNSMNAVVYYQPREDLIDTVKELNSYLINTKEEKDRSTQFYMQFFSNALKVMRIDKRVRNAVRNASKMVKFDIGDAPKKRKADDLGCDSESDSESSEAEDLSCQRRVKPLGKKPLDKKPLGKKPRAELRKISLATSSVPKMAAPSAEGRRIALTSSGPSSKRPAKEPESTLCLKQVFIDDLGIWVPDDDEPFVKPDNLDELVGVFHEAEQIARISFETGRAQFYASYSPDADWLGMHYASGVCLVNIGLVTEKSEMIGVICHEASHEYVETHDARFADYMQAHLSKVVEALLSK